MSEQSETARIRYQCRRGMLELDVFLPHYFDQHYPSMDDHKRSLFQQFLQEPDPDLFAWLMGFDSCKPEYQQLVDEIRNFQLTRKL